MRIGVLTDHRVVAVTDDDQAVEITELLAGLGGVRSPSAMLGRYSSQEAEVRRLVVDPATPRMPVAQLRFAAPSPHPRTVLAAPVNFQEHAGELGDRSPDRGALDARQLGLIVLATASVTGPDSVIELPRLPGREFHYEGEIAAVIGREASGVAEDQAMDCVLGYTGLIDVTLRLDDDHREDRSMRKSFHTFTPLGPFIVPAEDVGDPADLSLRLSVNGQLRQEGTLRDLVVPVAQLVSRASQLVPLLPGDVIATGTPAGVGPIVPGDMISLTVSNVGTLRMSVAARSW